MKPEHDLTGKTFGRLQVQGFARSDRQGRWWHCQCSCGRQCVARGTCLKDGNTQSCGCLRSETARRTSKHKALRIDVGGKLLTLKQVSAKYDIPIPTIRSRMKKGRDPLARVRE